MRHSSLVISASILGAMVLVLLLPGSAADEKRISIYSNAANFSLPVVDRDGKEYAGLLEILDPLGTVSAQTQGSHWTVRYNERLADFRAGSSVARIQGHDFEMPGKFLLENGKGLVPLNGLDALLGRILGGPVTVHAESRRVFIGSAGVHFTAQVTKNDPPSLVMNFTSQVNPTISTEPGKLRMTFTRDALVAPGTKSLTFDSKTIPSAEYDEQNGAAQVTVSSTAPLFASFSNGGKTISIVARTPQAASSKAPPAVAPVPQTAAANPVSTAIPPAEQPQLNPAVRYFAVVDPAHGGSERGAALSDTLAEKDVTMGIARRLKLALESQGFPTLLLREGDNTVSLDQRANLTNRAHPAVYVCLHATSQGQGVRLYTALLPENAENNGIFFSWDTAQSSYSPLSQKVGDAIKVELDKQRFPSRELRASLRPLNNVTTAAVAVEVSPPPGGVSDLNSLAYQDLIAKTIAAGISSSRNQLEAGR